MKTFLFTYESRGNIFKGKITIQASTISVAQDKFLDWLKKQNTYQHMWNLSFSADEIEGVL